MLSQPVRLCVSVLPRTAKQIPDLIASARDADLIELRLDKLPDIDCRRIRSITSKPLIAAFRTKNEGGFWERATMQRVGSYQAAINAGFDFIDVEWQTVKEVLPQIQLEQDTKLILSHHSNLNNTEKLFESLRKMIMVDADLYKFVYRAEELNDNFLVLQLIKYARKKQKDCIIHAQGKKGTLSRLLGAVRGNAWTYVSAISELSTAAGQLTLKTVKDQYFLKEKSDKTMIIGLVGNPIEHSKGWQLHNRLVHLKRKVLKNRNAGLRDFLYVNFPVSDFSKFWKRWESEIDGLSITIPHKENIIPFLCEKSHAVRISGVCNTAVRRKNNWIGYNTDYYAIKEMLTPHAEKLREGVLIIGTGATARSAIVALLECGIHEIYLMGRNKNRGELLKKKFGIRFMGNEVKGNFKVAGIIQATPLGMYPIVNKMPGSDKLFDEGMLVFDVIYNPPLTHFLQIARRKGCRILSGEELFIRQAAKQFEIFSKIKVSLHEVDFLWENITKNAEVTE